MRLGFAGKTSGLKRGEVGALSFFKQLQSDETASTFAIAGTGEDFSPAKARFVRSKSEARKIPSINFLVIFFTSSRLVNGSTPLTTSGSRFTVHK